jgi:hypothetical protein
MASNLAADELEVPESPRDLEVHDFFYYYYYYFSSLLQQQIICLLCFFHPLSLLCETNCLCAVEEERELAAHPSLCARSGWWRPGLIKP